MNESLKSAYSPIRNRALPLDVEYSILAGVLAASSDACWCMEFGDPVDLTAPDHEVVRQVFENDPFWRFANSAMAQLYLLDGGKTFTDRPVCEIFPRNRQNEKFVCHLLANGFEVDAAPALDRRYDGVEIYVANDVRAHIEGGRLIRMFGIVRDVGKNRRREIDLQQRLDAALALLLVVDRPLIALNADRRIEAVNLAAAKLLHRQIDDCLGQPLADLTIPTGQETKACDWDRVLAAATSGGSGVHLADDAGARWSVSPRPTGGVVLCLHSAVAERAR